MNNFVSHALIWVGGFLIGVGLTISLFNGNF